MLQPKQQTTVKCNVKAEHLAHYTYAPAPAAPPPPAVTNINNSDASVNTENPKKVNTENPKGVNEVMLRAQGGDWTVTMGTQRMLLRIV